MRFYLIQLFLVRIQRQPLTHMIQHMKIIRLIQHHHNNNNNNISININIMTNIHRFSNEYPYRHSCFFVLFCIHFDLYLKSLHMSVYKSPSDKRINRLFINFKRSLIQTVLTIVFFSRHLCGDKKMTVYRSIYSREFLYHFARVFHSDFRVY